MLGVQGELTESSTPEANLVRDRTPKVAVKDDRRRKKSSGRKKKNRRKKKKDPYQVRREREAELWGQEHVF